MLAKIKRLRYRIEADTPAYCRRRVRFTLPEAFDVRFYFRHPQALAIDSAAVRLTVADAKGPSGGTGIGDPDSVLPTEDRAHLSHFVVMESLGRTI